MGLLAMTSLSTLVVQTLRDRAVRTVHADSCDDIPQLDDEAVRQAVPAGWRLDALRAATPGP